MDNKTFNFLRIVKENNSQLTHHKMIKNSKLQTTKYYIEFFYKSITKMIEIEKLKNEILNF